MRPTLPLLALLVGLGFTGLQCAYADVPPPRASDGPVLDHSPPAAATPRIELVDDGLRSGSPDVRTRGGRRYVLGQMGQRYQVRVVNPTGSRIEAVVSVDGLDAVDGRAGNLNKRGYIVPAYGEVTILRPSHLSRCGRRVSLLVGSRLLRFARTLGMRATSASWVSRSSVSALRAVSRGNAWPNPGVRRAVPSSPVDDVRTESPGQREPGAPEQVGGRGLGHPPRALASARNSASRESRVSWRRASSGGGRRPIAISELRYDDRDGLLSRGSPFDSAGGRDPPDAENDFRDTAQPFPQSRFAQPPR